MAVASLLAATATVVAPAPAFATVAQLAVSTTAYSAATSQPGAPVTYQAVARVLAGADESSAVSVTQTVPTGVVPVGAFGTGWVCEAPAGQAVTCTTTATSFTGGTTLPTVTISAIVTSANLTATTIRTSSITRASSADADPATATTMLAGTVPSPPNNLSVTPSSGVPAGGGAVTIGGTSISGATAIEIGTTAEQQAGTPVTLLPCPGAAAPGCFTVNGSSLIVSAWPSRAVAASTSVTVVTLGTANATTYTYVDRPGVPNAPTAVAGITSATVSWTAPASNGSPVKDCWITPYQAGVKQTAEKFSVSTTSRIFTGLTVAVTYRFTVYCSNDYGNSNESLPSADVIPYQLPGAPTITAATAGPSSATLTWTAPADGGSAISGYLVTPYVNGSARSTQTFGPGTTQTAVGLVPGTTYTFKVAAVNLAGTGPQSSASTAVTVVQALVPGLALSLAPASGSVTAGQPVAYTVTITNTGQTAYQPAVLTIPLAESLDDATYEPSQSHASVGNLDYVSSTIQWAGGLAVGASATVTFTLTTTFPAGGNHALDTALTSLSVGATCVTGTEPGCASQVTVLVPKLTVTKKADTAKAPVGARVGYTVTATNTGQSDYPSVALSDSLAQVLTHATYGGDATAATGVIAYTGGVMTWSGTLPVGASVTVTYSVQVLAGDPGTEPLVNTVTSDATGSTCPSATAGDDPDCTTTTTLVPDGISLSGTTPSFTLTGAPRSVVSQDGAVTLTVTTNSPGGYAVSVLPGGNLTGADPENPDTVLVSALGVRESGTDSWTVLSKGGSTGVHTQYGPSAPGGDAVSTDYQVTVPFVAPDTYSTTIDYIVSAQ